VRTALPDTPIYVGSGASTQTLPSLLAVANGAIIGTAAKFDGVADNRIDLQRVRALVAAGK
jgi:uncharacterized protein